MRFFPLFATLLSILNSYAQVPSSYPKSYFRYPLAIAPRLNANFGEMRHNHFHMGLDLFTLKKENLPIFAAADGYVAKIKIEPGGFGNAIYLNHPNGFTTLYAHMNEFMPALQQYVKEKQYESESWSTELEIPEDEFPVKKGDLIGYSGNTGGSQGPHVHFEIRETATDKCLNPLLFGFAIPDNIPPAIVRLAIYNRNVSMYEQSPILIPLKKSGTVYTAAGTVRLNFDKIAIAIQATDRMNVVPNTNGIYSTTVFDGNQLVGGFEIDRISYDETRYLNAHIDYKTNSWGGPYLQTMFPVGGDKLEIYKSGGAKNFLELKDSSIHALKIDVGDAYGNTSQVKFFLQRSAVIPPPDRQSGYLMKAGEVNIYETDNLQVYLPENCLYDSIHFIYSSAPNISGLAFSPEFQVHSYNTPVHENFTIRIKPDRVIPYALRDKILVMKITKEEVDVKKANWELGWYTARFREFGLFQLVADNEPPQIIPYALKDGANLSKSQKIVVSAKDNYDAIKSFRAELDGKWLMFSQHGNTFTYKFDEHCLPGNHRLKIVVEDEAGNRAERSWGFVR